eukprot:760115-Amphidinium_carterae.2
MAAAAREDETTVEIHWKAIASKEIRRWQERKAFFERTKLPNPDAYPWHEDCANMEDLRDMAPFEIGNVCSRARWQLGTRGWLRDYCYQEYTTTQAGLRYWCYVCLKGGGRDVPLARCAACDNVFMCMEHRIFPDCMHNFYDNRITICCRHSRYTPGLGSWNPMGGYPPLKHTSEVKKQEDWREEGWIPSAEELQLIQQLQGPVVEETTEEETQ